MTKTVVNKKTGKVYIYENYKPKKKQAKPRKKRDDELYFGIKIPVRRDKTEKQYAEEIFEKNRQSIERAYNKEQEKRQIMFEKYGKKSDVTYKNAFDYFYKRSKFYKEVEKSSFKQATMKVIETNVADKLEVFVTNFMKGLKTYAEDEYERFMAIVEEQGDKFDFRRFKYEGGATYSYTLTNGKQIVIILFNSPLEWRVYFNG